MDDFGALLNTALTIVTLATLAGLGLLRGTVTNLRERLNDRAQENAELKERLLDAEGKLKETKADLDTLKRVVTGEVHWSALTELLTAHHAEANEHWDATEETLQLILEQLKNLPTRGEL